MSTKKRTSKKTTKKKRPTKAMLKEIAKVLEKHNSTGVTIRFSDSIGSLAESTGDAHGLAPTPDSLNCTSPKKPTHVCKTLPNGTIVCGWVCR
jgi:hypothetical protein